MNALEGGRATATRALIRALWLCACIALASACDDGAQQATGELGELSLPITATRAGVTYRLNGTFSIRESDDSSVPILRTLRTEDDRDAPVVRTTLPEGDYYIFLEPGWTLERLWDGVLDEGAARLAIQNPFRVTVRGGALVHAVFLFDVSAPPTEHGTLVIGIDVIAPPVCGNGYLEQGEFCDWGSHNGSPNGCDGACSFRCTGPCPLRVHPGSQVAHGSGASWDDPLTDLQTAIDQQAALGGGEVWVRGGEFAALRSSSGMLLDVRSKVVLRGGFAGSERSASERAADSPPTVLADVRSNGSDETVGDAAFNLLSIRSQSDVTIERVRLEGSGYLLGVRDSLRVTLSDVSLARYRGSVLDRSEVRFERARFEPDLAPLHAREAKLAFVDSAFVSQHDGIPYKPGSLVAVASTVSFERVRSDGPASFDADSHALLLNSTFRASWNRGSYVDAYDALVVGSRFINDGLWSITSQAPLLGQSLFVFNSSFVRLSVNLRESIVSNAAIEAGDVEVAASSFFDNRCTRTTHPPCSVDVVARENGLVHNSLFVHDTATQYPGDPQATGVGPGIMQAGNCTSYDRAAFDAEPDGSGSVLARVHPCPDAGDAALLEAARLRLLARAAIYRLWPHMADLSRYEAPTWWRGESAVVGRCSDEGAPDPGSHFALACPAP